MQRLAQWILSATKANRHKLELVIVAGLVTVAASPWNAIFDDWTYLIAVASAAVLAIFVSAVCFAVRAPWWLTALLAFAGVIVVVGEFAYPSDAVVGLPTPAMVASVFDGLTGSWSALLSAGLPANPDGDVLVLPMTTAFAAAYVSSELVLRRRWIVAPVLPPLISFGVALAFAGSVRDESLLVAVLITVGVLGVVYRRANPPVARASAASGAAVGQRTRLDRGTAAVLVAVVVAGIVGGWALPVLAGSRPFGVRDHYTKPIDINDEVSPLASLQARADAIADQPLFRVTFGPIPAGVTIDRIPFALLDSYDGAVWGTATQFDRAGRRVPPGAESDAPSTNIRQQYTLEGWNSSFAPALERPVSLSGDEQHLGVDPVTGMLAVSLDAPPKLSYAVVSAIPTLSTERLEAAPRANDPVLAAFVQKPDDVPDAFQRFAVDALPATGSDFDRLDALAKKLGSEPYAFSTKALPGHSLGRLTQLVAPDPAAPAPSANHLGTSEQYAAAFALAARLVNYPSRVVVGYLVDPAAVARGDEIVVRGKDVVAWPEVFLDTVGWVRFNPTSTTEREPDTSTPPVTALPTLPKDVIESDLAERGCGNDCIAVAASASGSSFSLAWLLFVPLALVLGIVAVVVTRFLRRRGRRAARDPAARIVGAWRESSDRLVAYGLVPRRASLTPNDMAALVVDRMAAGAGYLESLTPLLDAALYDPTPPTRTAANESWELERALRTELARRVPLSVRLRAMIDPRPLLPRRQHDAAEPAREPELV